MRPRLVGLALLSLATVPRFAAAQVRPSLDDFYERGRGRAEGFESCTGECDGRHVVGFLVGAQLADPVDTDGARRLAYGGRFGVDAGLAYGRYDIVRSRAWVDLLRVSGRSRTLADVTLDSSWFHVLGEHGGPGERDMGNVQLSLHPRLVQRAELEASDLAELQVSPYRMWDVEAEAAPIGPKVDKDAFLALPIGLGLARRWDQEGARLEDRRVLTAAIALRGFPKELRHHYQFEVLRVTRTLWNTPGGDADGWSGVFGYQRLSPDIDWLELWLQGGFGWYRASSRANGALGRIGAELRPTRALVVGPSYEATFVLDRRTQDMVRVHDLRLFVDQGIGPVRLRLTYQGAVLLGTMFHALSPEASVRVGPMEVRARYRVTRGVDPAVLSTSLADRFQASVDWLF